MLIRALDDPSDVVYMSTTDAQWDVMSLLSVLSDGLETPHIVSVNLDVTYTAHRRGATIVSVNLPEPLHEGVNTARVSMLAYGVLATQTVLPAAYGVLGASGSATQPGGCPACWSGAGQGLTWRA